MESVSAVGFPRSTQTFVAASLFDHTTLLYGVHEGSTKPLPDWTKVQRLSQALARLLPDRGGRFDNAMVKAIARAFRWRELLENGACQCRVPYILTARSSSIFCASSAASFFLR
jgi:hypothetical protein